MRKQKTIFTNAIEGTKKEKGINGKNKYAGNFSFKKVKENKSKKIEETEE